MFHYELEFIHPFMDGNGRMGRLWQTAILMRDFPLFESLPFETLIAKEQARYYKALSLSDKEGKSTRFIQYMLEVIDQSLEELLQTATRKPDEGERLRMFLDQCPAEFTRKDYLKKYSDISTATASRDLANGVRMKLIRRIGDKNTALYKKEKVKF